MRTRAKLSLLSETKLPEEMLSQLARLFSRLCLLVYAIPITIIALRTLLVDHHPLGLINLSLYLVAALLVWRYSARNPRALLQFMIVLLAIASVTITLRSQAILLSGNIVLLATLGLSLLTGLRQTLLISTLHMSVLLALVLFLNSAEMIRILIQTSSAIALQVAILIATNAMRNLFLDKKHHLEQLANHNQELIDQLSLATAESGIRIIEENLTKGGARYLAPGTRTGPEALTYQDRLKMVPSEHHTALVHAYAEPGNVAEYPLNRCEGIAGEQWIRQRFIRKFDRDGDEIALFLVVYTTKERKAQRQLQRSLQQVEETLARQSEIAQAGEIGLFEWAVDSDIVRSNLIFRRHTGLDEQNYPIVRISDLTALFSEDDAQAFLQKMQQAVPADGTIEYQLEMKLASGEQRWVRLTASVHERDEGGYDIYGSLIDLTEHLQLEQQLRNANAALQRQSRTDPLTHLANRREMDDYLESQLTLRQRDSSSSFSLVLADIDYFKPYNDHYGHPAGDEVLQKVAEILGKSARRPADLAVRFGGEEFVLILPDTDLEGAQKVCRRVQTALQANPIQHEKSPLNRLSLSLGITTLHPGVLATPAALISAADVALYAAKEQGRNQFVYQEPEA